MEDANIEKAQSYQKQKKKINWIALFQVISFVVLIILATSTMVYKQSAINMCYQICNTTYMTEDIISDGISCSCYLNRTLPKFAFIYNESNISQNIDYNIYFPIS